MPEHKQIIPVTGYTAADILALSYGTLEQLSWTIKYAAGNLLIGYTPKSWKRYDNEITIEAEDGQLTITSKMVHGEAFDMMGRTKKDVAGFLEAFEAGKAKVMTGKTEEWKQKIEALQQDTVKIAEEEIKQTEEVDKVMNLSKGGTQLTYGIITINVAVFVLMAFSGVSIFDPSATDILKWGGNLPVLTFGGDWWRLFTCMFVHIGIVHILLNMYALYSVSVYLEPMLGKTRFIAAYLCSGLLASLVSIIWNQSEHITSAGASGAIFGMYGVFLALLTTHIIPRQVRQTMLQSILIFVAYNIFYGLKPESGIDNAAHIGGLLSGMAIGYVYYFSFKEPSEKKTKNIISLVALATLLILFATLRNEKTEPVRVDYKTGEIFYKESETQFSE